MWAITATIFFDKLNIRLLIRLCYKISNHPNKHLRQLLNYDAKRTLKTERQHEKVIQILRMFQIQRSPGRTGRRKQQERRNFDIARMTSQRGNRRTTVQQAEAQGTIEKSTGELSMIQGSGTGVKDLPRTYFHTGYYRNQLKRMYKN